MEPRAVSALPLDDEDTIRVDGPKATAADIITALDKRYEQTTSEKWVRIVEARSGAGFAGNNRQCDYLAVNTWQSGGLQVIGHEVKVSYSDWKRELADTDKAETFSRFCRRWWVVAPSDLAKRIHPELPPAWGLLGVTAKGVCREVAPAPARDPETIPPMWWVGWLAQIDRRQRRREGDALNAEVNRRVEAERQSWEHTWESTHRFKQEQGSRLAEQVREFEAATGINIAHGWKSTWAKYAELARISRDAPPDFNVALTNAEKAIAGIRSALSVVDPNGGQSV
jgi:hypothetical protein